MSDTTTKTYQHLLFDLDNTLVNFDQSEERALRYVYAQYFSAEPYERFINYYQRYNQQVWKQVEACNLRPRQAALLRFQRLTSHYPSIEQSYNRIALDYEQQLAIHCQWLPGIPAALQQLASHYTLGIVTNGLENVQQQKYQLMQLQTWFACYIISDSVEINKPDPRIFNVALQQLQAEASSTLMIGDSLSSDFRGALNADIDFCWVNPKQSKLPSGWPEPSFDVSSVTELYKNLQPTKDYAETIGAGTTTLHTE